MDELKTLYDIPVKVTVILGSSNLKIKDVLKLGRGSILELNKRITEPVSICVNDKEVASGEILVIDDRLAITITNIFTNEKKT